MLKHCLYGSVIIIPVQGLLFWKVVKINVPGSKARRALLDKFVVFQRPRRYQRDLQLM